MTSGAPPARALAGLSWCPEEASAFSAVKLSPAVQASPHTTLWAGVSLRAEFSPITGTSLPELWSWEQRERAATLTHLVVPQAVNGNRNRTKACVAITGLQSLSFLKARCTEFKSSGGTVTFRDTAMEKWPSRVQRAVTGTPERLSASEPAGQKPKDLVVLTPPPEKLALLAATDLDQLPRASRLWLSTWV